MLSAVIPGVLVTAISSTGRWIIGQSTAPHTSRSKRDVEIATWFDTYRLTDSAPEMPTLPHGLHEDRLSQTLEANEVQACLHELIAVRMTDSPESTAEDVRRCFNATLQYLNPAIELEQFSNTVFSYYDYQISGLTARLRGAQPDLYQKLRTEAYSARLTAILASARPHCASILGQHGYAVESQYLDNYRRHVREFHGKLQPPDFDRRQRIPIDQIYVAPTIIRYADIAHRRPRAIANPAISMARVDIENDADAMGNSISLDDLASEIDRTVLLGDPGGGKSTAANVIMYRYSQRDLVRIPFLVTLREYAAGEGRPTQSIIAHIEHNLDVLYQSKPPEGLIARLCLGGNALVIFDGLDELIETSRRLEVTEAVEHFCTEYPLARVLVTSRLVGYNEARLDPSQFVPYRLAGFSDQQVAEYVKKWFAQDEGLSVEASRQWADSFLDESSSVPDLRQNPLMLALMCILYLGEGSIPRNRPEVYEQCADLLFRKWDMRRRIKVEVRAHSLIEPALRHLAYWLFTRAEPQSTVAEAELVRETAAFFRTRGYESDDESAESAKQFIEFCRGRAWVFSDAGTTAAGEVLYTFTHRTFLEYFAGAYLAIAEDSAESLGKTLLPHVAKAEWDVVAELALQKKDQISDRGAERAIVTMLSDKRRLSARGRSNILQFLARCVAWIDVPRSLIGDLTYKTLEHLRSGDPDDQISYLPIGILCGAPLERCDLILSQILAWMDAKLQSDDEGDKRLALHVGTYLDILSWAIPRGGPVDLSTSDFWRDACTRVRTEKADLIVREAANDQGMLILGLTEHFIPVSGVLAACNGDVTRLFSGCPIGIYSVSWSPYLPLLVWKCVRSDDMDHQLDLADLRAVGEYLLQLPSFPWCIGIEGQVPAFALRSEGAAVREREFDEVSYLALAVIICTVLECAGPDGRNTEWMTLVPGLEEYIQLRWSEEGPNMPSERLGKLPIPARFAAVMRSWATHEVSFARTDAREVPVS